MGFGGAETASIGLCAGRKLAMTELHANLWSTPADARCITTNGTVKLNGECVMGRGCAAQAKARYPTLPLMLGDLIKSFGNHTRVIPSAIVPDILIAFPVKHEWWEPADMSLIEQSAYELVDLASDYQLKAVLLPRPGCGNGQLKWSDVKPVIQDILDNRFTVVSL